MNGNALSSSACALGAGAGRGDVGGLQRLGVPGHRAAFARDMEADRELAARERLRVASRTAARPHRSRRTSPGCDRDARLAAEASPAGSCPARASRCRMLQPDEDAVEGHRLGAERVGEAQPRLLAPDLGHARSGGRSGRARRPRAPGKANSAPAAPTDCRPGRGRAPRPPSSSPICRAACVGPGSAGI